ncbi:hypothetical protein SAMN02745216_00898 [Desulfatibacillum alkenivorans DSM 16219]|uniref:Antitoxin n=1 Tax=Desulfatibacillum alkenivorans DSM 16219 TaxID=1121393 RepID=A0A1M6FSC0_9BACT|nr:DUF6364 family protein [Desulfatibacillum alkenivorans]SHJ00601.1 hypothetical protein SAMN02745216_00898 [Desulfatibacillum alkenivorans DSM 16219]
MHKKLTLKMDNAAIEAAKSFGKANQTSVSKLVETYFKTLTHNSVSANRIPGVVGELAGILKGKDVDYIQKDYTNYLESKYK